VSDLFYMRNWYMPGLGKNAVSDGTADNQANIADVNKLPLLPMIPQQMLLIRNVIVKAEWNAADKEILNACYSGDQASTDSSASKVAATGGVCLGFINFGGSASHSQGQSQGQGSRWEAKSGSSHFGTTFDGTTLRIPGAQIIAFLSDIVPSSPPLDDPALVKPEQKKPKITADSLKIAI
jgi:hypothetical protein